MEESIRVLDGLVRQGNVLYFGPTGKPGGFPRRKRGQEVWAESVGRNRARPASSVEAAPAGAG